MADSQYWATEPTEQIASAVMERVDRYYRYLDESGRLRAWRRLTATYYGKDEGGTWSDSVLVNYGGEEGEMVLQRVNHFGSVLDHTLVLATASRPSFSCRAINSDFRSQAQATLGDGLLEWYLTEQNVEEKTREGLRRALMVTEGWLYCGWDPNAGDVIASEERPMPGHEEAWKAYQAAMETELGDGSAETIEAPEKPPTYKRQIMSGDVCVEVHHPIDVIRDVSKSNPRDFQWLILRRRENKWDMGIKYPDNREDIMNAEAKTTQSTQSVMWDWEKPKETDDVFVYHLFHDRTAAVPNGRYAIIVGDVCVFDGDLPYDEIPMRAEMPSEELDTAFGFSRMLSVHPLQEGLDAAISTAATNNDAMGVSNVWTGPEGSAGISMFTEAMRLWETTNKPERVDLGGGSEDSYKLAEYYQRAIEMISGINSVARGEPQASLKSGSALALVHSMAMQYNSGVQETYAQALEWVMTRIIKLLQEFAGSPRIAEISGKRRKPILREFTGDDIQAIRRVKVEIGTAITRTTAGRKEIADKLFEQKAISPEQYFEVLATGRLDPVFERPRAQRGLVDQENEELIDGHEVRAIWTDDHDMHIQEHMVLLDEPSIRQDDAAVALITAHVQEHIQLRVQMPPHLAEMTGQRPLMSLASGPPGAGPGGPPPPAGGPPGAPPVPEAQAQVPGVTDSPTPAGPIVQSKIPNMPTNPLTGEPANPQGGVQ